MAFNARVSPPPPERDALCVRHPLQPLPLHLLHPPCQSRHTSPTAVSAFSSWSPRPRTPPLSLHSISMAHLADTFARIVSHVCSRAQPSALPNCSDPLAFFFCPTKQTSFTMSYYCRRLLHFNHCSKSCVPLALVYLLRLEANQRMQINDYNVHRLVCTAFVLAAKWHDDVSYTNAHYASVGGVPSVREMNILETHMLTLLDHRLFVSADRYQLMENYILQLAQLPER